MLLEGADEIFGVVVQTVEEEALPELGVDSDVASYQRVFKKSSLLK